MGLAGAPGLIGIAEALVEPIDCGGTRCRMRGPNGEVYEEKTPVEYLRGIELIERMTRECYGDTTPDVVVLAVAGEPGSGDRKGQLVKAGKLQEYGWLGRNVADDIQQVLGVSAVLLVGDCDAGAYAEGYHHYQNRDVQGDAGSFGMFTTISTGFGASLWTPRSERTPDWMRVGYIHDEPGHEQMPTYGADEETAAYIERAVCGCGGKRHMEGCFSGSGTELNDGRRGEDIPDDDRAWHIVQSCLATGLEATLDRYVTDYDVSVQMISYVGSVAVNRPGIMMHARRHLERAMMPPPRLQEAVHGELSGLEGAYLLGRHFSQAA